jgi:hypothetical protein
MKLDLSTWLTIRDDLCKQHNVTPIPLSECEITGTPSQTFDLIYERINQTKWIGEPIDYIHERVGEA